MFRHLEAFVETAKMGSVTQAAEALFITQPTVSGQLRELEEELATVLFHRLPRGVELSEAGKRFLPRAIEILESRKKLLYEASEYNGLLRGTLEIHASNIPGEYLVPLCLSQFKDIHPSLRLICKVHDSAETIDKVASGEAYLGVVGTTDDNPDLEFIPLWEDRLELFTSTKNLKLPETITLEELSKAPLIIREEGSASRLEALRTLAEAGVELSKLNVLMELGSTTAVKMALTADVGAAFISTVAVEKEVAEGELRKVTVEGLAPVERRFYLVKNKRRELTPAARVFSEFALTRSAHCYAVASASGSSSPSAEELAPKNFDTQMDIS